MNFCQTSSSRLQGEYCTTLQVLPNLEIKRSMKTLNNIDVMATMLTALKSRHSYYNVQALILRNHDRLIVGGQGISFAEWKIANYVHECLWPLLLLHSVHYELALHPSVTLHSCFHNRTGSTNQKWKKQTVGYLSLLQNGSNASDAQHFITHHRAVP